MIRLINNFSNFSKSIIKTLVPSYVGMLRVKAGRPLVNHLKNMVLLVKGSITKSLVKVIISYIRFLYVLNKRNGSAFVAKYLKSCVSLLMQSISGPRHHSSHELGIAIARTGSGLPRVIPSVHRHHIRAGNTYYIRLWLSLLSIYRVLDFIGKLKIDTIVKPGNAKIDFDEVRRAVVSLKIRESLEVKSQTNFYPFWIPSSSPTSTKRVLKEDDRTKVLLPSSYSTSIGSILNAAYSLAHSPDILKSMIDFAKGMAVKGPVLTYLEFILSVKGLFKLPYNLNLKRLADKNTIKTVTYKDVSPLGKLAFKIEPAGKVRVFAMVDPFTQWLLAPLHKSIFAFLRTLPSDATFDQRGAVNAFAERLKKEKILEVYSFDITAATDRIPGIVQADVLTHSLWRGSVGNHWLSLLVNRWYAIPFPEWDPSAVLAKRLGFDPNNLPDNVRGVRFMWKGKMQTFIVAVKYIVGQPMGALSSWGMLALVHHVVVRMAALRVNKPFFDFYMVLGDDLVIADKAVANAYLAIMKEWDVGINLSKSIISNNGSFEFAKRFFYKYQDVSGLSFKEMAVARWNLRVLLQLFANISTFRHSRISEMLSFLGHGYKALSRMSGLYSKMSRSMRRTLLLFSYPGMQFSKFLHYSDWLGSTAFNRYYKTEFTLEAKKILLADLNKMASRFPPMQTPSKMVNLDNVIYKFLEGSSGYESWMKKPASNSIPWKEPYSGFIMQLRFLLKSLFDPLWDYYTKVQNDVRTACRDYNALDPSAITLDNIWMTYDDIESISKKLSEVSDFRTIKDVQTLNKSKVLRRADSIRATLLRFANENKRIT